jgi:hypothetical protein
MRRTTCLALLIVGCLLTAASAAGQTVDLTVVEGTASNAIGTVTSTTTGVVGTVGNAVDQATGSSAGSTVSSSAGSTVSSSAGSTVSSSAGSTVSGVADTATSVSGSSLATDSSSSGSTSSGDRRSASSRRSASDSGASRPRIRTRFDRLPRRLETLLERIELGQNVRANLRRLERALASASPEMRTRVLRLIRAEIARLRRGGTTPRDRRRIERLRFALEMLTRGSPPAAELSPTSGVASSEPVTPGEQPGRTRNEPGPKTGVLETQAGGRDEQPQTPPLLPPQRDEVPFLLGVLALAALILGFLGLVAGVTRHVLRSG